MDLSGTVTKEAKLDIKKKKNLCQHDSCRRKLGLIPFHCKCGLSFCGEHRFSENHECTIDYRALQRKELLKNMSSPIIGLKVEVI